MNYSSSESRYFFIDFANRLALFCVIMPHHSDCRLLC